MLVKMDADARPDKIALIVDDEATIRAYLKVFLRREGFHTVEASNGVEALEVMGRLGAAVDVLVSDVLMPVMDGIALARAMRTEYPKTPLILFSGYINAEQMRDLNVTFLQKPFPPAALIDAITTSMTPKKGPRSEAQQSRSLWGKSREAGG